MSDGGKVSARIKNFTPLLDELVQKYGVMTAAVWGRVWRYSKQENGVCQASHEKIASELNISSRTVIRHLQLLAKNGYLKDHTPALRNRPHTYSITRKAHILITVEGVTESHTTDEVGVTESPTGVTESHTGVTESPTGYDRKSHEETIKKQIKKQVKKQRATVDELIELVPESLSRSDFLDAWREWIEYRAEDIKKPLTARAAKIQLNKLEKAGAPTAIAMMQKAIEHSWQTVYELDNRQKNASDKRNAYSIPDGV